jgi:two-component system alkaline phosphatase synthesis response regulator PhoP
MSDSNKQNILIIEDEQTIATLISYNLKKEGYNTTILNDGSQALQELQRADYDMMLLDVMLPGTDGFQILSTVRRMGMKLPIIMVTARNTEEEIVQGLMNGADDYMIKPFGVAELIARISTVLRRSPDLQINTQQAKQLNIGSLTVFPEKYEVYFKTEFIALRPKEFQILLCLYEHPGRIFSRDDLMNQVWGYDYFGDQRTVDVHVSSLRKKIEVAGDNVKIEAIRGVGYKMILS